MHAATIRAISAGCAVLGAATLALANGGPVAWTTGTGTGGVAPRQEHDIRLISEDLRISLEDDLDHYNVAAVYTLENPGDAREVDFGVPLTWDDERGSSEVASGITLSLDGVSSTCTPQEEREREMLRESGPKRSGTAWCVTRLSFAAERRQRLELAYRAELEFEDMIFSKSALVKFSDRTLRYALAPAGYWSGLAERVQIEVALGRYAGRAAAVSPAGADAASDTLRWELRQVDLKQLGELRIELDPVDLKKHTELATWNRTAEPHARVPLRARASSELSDARGRYQAAGVLDGDPNTAWCEGVEGAGEGEWIEVRTEGDPKVPSYCRLQGVAIVPGYAKSQDLYRANGRVRGVSLLPCDGSAPTDGPLPIRLSDQHDTSARLLGLDWRAVASFKRGDDAPFCMRVVLHSVAPGERFADTCISELALVMNCG